MNDTKPDTNYLENLLVVFLTMLSDVNSYYNGLKEPAYSTNPTQLWIVYGIYFP